MSGKIKFGWRTPDWPVPGSTGREMRDQWLAFMDVVEEHYDSVWVADHFFPWMASLDQRLDVFEAWTTIAFLLGRFKKVQLGSIVLSQSYRPPALLAKSAATLQELSGGRLILGIGAGWKENEYLAYGYDYPSAATRIAQLEEAVRVIRAMWTQSSPSFHGKYYNIEAAYSCPKPDPMIPILIGGGGRKLTLRVVAKLADWWNFPGGTLENYASLLDTLRGHCEAVGRNYDSIVKTWGHECVAVAETHEKAEQIARSSQLWGENAIYGTPDEVAKKIQPFVDLGVEHFIFRFADFPGAAGASFFAKEVMPRFA